MHISSTEIPLSFSIMCIQQTNYISIQQDGRIYLENNSFGNLKFCSMACMNAYVLFAHLSSQF